MKKEIKTKTKNCLLCGKEFQSTGATNRLCKSCNIKNKNKQQGALHYGLTPYRRVIQEKD